MTKQAELRDLLEQVVNAEGPSRELDAQIHEALIGPVEVDHDGDRFLLTPRGGFAQLEHYTASLDAALAFKERMLPGSMLDVRWSGIGKYYVRAKEPRYYFTHKCLALALVAAVLLALIEQESE